MVRTPPAVACAALLVVLALLASCQSLGQTPTYVLPPPLSTTSETTAATPAPSVPTAAVAATPGLAPPADTTVEDVAATPANPASDEGATPPVDSFPAPPERDLYKLAAELNPDAIQGDRIVNDSPVEYQVGRRDTFWMVDLAKLERYQSEFDLRLVSPHAYWYVEAGLEIPQQDLELAAANFEETVYPRVTGVFGQEWVPGVDNDTHLTVLNASINLAGGYFSSVDEYPRYIRPYSNEREMIYINADAIPVDSPGYLNVLAHELQHAVHWKADSSEESWVNEGLAELAVHMSGGEPTSIQRFLRAGPTSLVHWSLLPVAPIGSYGSVSLFMHYLTEQYGGREDLKPLVGQTADGIPGLDAFLREGGYGVGFYDVFRDWAVANLLDEDQGLYSYQEMDVNVRRLRELRLGDEMESQIPQYATEYVVLKELDGPATLSFRGETETQLLPVDVGPNGCWWSNSGDSIDSTLARRLDLRDATGARLQFEAWFNIEEGWDYGYLEVSTDGGAAWTVLETPNTTSENPVGNAYGPGYSGYSQGWVEESLDLDAYLGGIVWVRFQYITDDSVSDAGLCVRNLELLGAGEFAAGDAWVPDGFVFVNNRVAQDFIVQLVYQGDTNRVVHLELSDDNTGQITTPDSGDFDRVVVVVQSMAANTREPASDTLTLGP